MTGRSRRARIASGVRRPGRAGTPSEPPAASWISRRRARSATENGVSGSLTDSATPSKKRCSVCDAEALQNPRLLLSELTYATALRSSSSACVSAHSVEPSSPGSSPSHAQ
jgi:hypothetical protein